jgi:hypothetical protein
MIRCRRAGARGPSKARSSEVDVVVDGSTEPVGSGFVTGGSGPDLAPFTGSVRFPSPRGGWGSVIFFTRSMDNGQVWEATTVRVGFIGGD